MEETLSRHRVSLFHGVLTACLVAGAAFILVVKTQPARSLRAREEQWHHTLAPGDLVFQDLDCGFRCDLIRFATHSAYSHLGIVLADPKGPPVVWESFDAVGPMPLVDFVERGRDRLLAVYRLEPSLLEQLPAITSAVEAWRGRPYDGDYQWDDERIYCSELVEKSVQQATGVELSPPVPLGAGAFGNYAASIKKLTGGRLTESTPITSPVDLTRSPHLQRIVDELEGSLATDAGAAH